MGTTTAVRRFVVSLCAAGRTTSVATARTTINPQPSEHPPGYRNPRYAHLSFMQVE